MRSFIALVLLFSVSVFATENSMKFVPVDEIYSPKGFDTNDNVEVVVTGYLPNLCYHSPKAILEKIDGNKIQVSVKAFYKYELNDYCPEIIVPFTETLELGMLKKGNYEIVVNKDQSVAAIDKFEVIDNLSPYQDDYIYLYVDYVKKDYENKMIEIVGLNPSDCFKFEEVKFVSNGNNTISVLPILKKTTDFCPMKMTPMTISVKVPKLIEKTKILLHVRSMEGKSYNTLFMQ